jgi:hypothetical protein
MVETNELKFLTPELISDATEAFKTFDAEDTGSVASF